jgi:hypothetical protein
VLLAGCGSSGVGTTTRARAAPAAPAPVTATTTAGAPQARLSGPDYSLVLEPGWRDTTSTAPSAGPNDRVIALHLPRTVVVFAVRRAPHGAGAATLLRARAARELAAARPTQRTRPRSLKLDGAPAITYKYRATTAAGAKIQARQVITLHGGRIHTITMVVAQPRFAVADEALGAMLATWRWR